MRFTHDLEYDAAPEQVYAMLATLAFREEVCAALQVVRSTVSVKPKDDGMEVEVDQTQPDKGIPSFARRFVGDEIHIVQRESWSSPSGAALELTIPGKPGSVRGAITLAAAGSGSVERVEAEVKVPIPLVGGKLENLIAGRIRAALEVENGVGRRWLAGPG